MRDTLRTETDLKGRAGFVLSDTVTSVGGLPLTSERRDAGGVLPFVSVIMPVFNEGQYIRKSIEALLSQSYPADMFEIVVADGMSTDGTGDVVREFSSRSKVPIRLVDNPKQIAPAGLNSAIGETTGSIIIRVDGHCEVDPDYIKNCVRHLVDKKADGVGGPISTIGETMQATAISLAMSSRFGVGNSAFRTADGREMYVDTVAFPGYTREVIERAGKFDEELVRNQDDEYNYRIRKMGGRILLSPDIRSLYYSRSSFRSLWRQYFQYGYWKVRVLQKHPRQMSLRQFVPAAFILALIMLGIFAVFSPIGKLLLAAFVALYLLASIASSLFLSMRAEPRIFPLLPLSFAILHFSYGLGFLTGLVSFHRRWRR